MPTAAWCSGYSTRTGYGPVWYIVAFGLAFVSVTASIALNLALAVYFALPGPVRPKDAFTEKFPIEFP